MKIVSFRPNGTHGQWRAGFLENGLIVVGSDIGYPDTVRELLVQYGSELDVAVTAARSALAQDVNVIKEASVTLGPPVPDPDKILCLGLNYLDHAAEANREVPAFPPVFSKFRNSLIGPRDSIVMPDISTEIDYEAELAIIIGTRCKSVSVDEAMNYVAGYSVFNDVSARDVQVRTQQWTSGKMLDTFGPMGPGITPRQEVNDAQNLRIRARVNGVTVQDSNTSAMVWPIAEVVAYLSSIATLEPGDIIATGTPAGVGLARTPPLWLKPNDTVEIEIEQLGTISNAVIADHVSAERTAVGS